MGDLIFLLLAGGLAVFGAFFTFFRAGLRSCLTGAAGVISLTSGLELRPRNLARLGVGRLVGASDWLLDDRAVTERARFFPSCFVIPESTTSTALVLAAPFFDFVTGSGVVGAGDVSSDSELDWEPSSAAA